MFVEKTNTSSRWECISEGCARNAENYFVNSWFLLGVLNVTSLQVSCSSSLESRKGNADKEEITVNDEKKKGNADKEGINVNDEKKKGNADKEGITVYDEEEKGLNEVMEQKMVRTVF